MDGESFFRGLILFLMADILVMLLIWIFFYGLPRWKRNKRPAQRNPQDRDRYIPLISCIILLVAVEGFLFKLARATFMTGNQYAVRTVIGFVFIDAILLLSILPFLTGHRGIETGETQGINFDKNKTGPFSFLAGWLLHVSSVVEMVITSSWFKPVLFLIFIFWCINSTCRSCSKWPDG